MGQLSVMGHRIQKDWGTEYSLGLYLKWYSYLKKRKNKGVKETQNWHKGISET